MTVLEWRDMGDGVWLPSKCVNKASVEQHQAEEVVTLSKAEVNDDSIGRFFTSFEWPKGSQYYDERLNATVIPNATKENMGKALDSFTADSVRDLEATLPKESANDHETGASTPSDHPIGAAPTVEPTHARYWLYLALSIAAFLAVFAWIWKRYRRRTDASA
jgi:hypothetical protein